MIKAVHQSKDRDSVVDSESNLFENLRERLLDFVVISVRANTDNDAASGFGKERERSW